MNLMKLNSCLYLDERRDNLPQVTLDELRSPVRRSDLSDRRPGGPVGRFHATGADSRRRGRCWSVLPAIYPGRLYVEIAASPRRRRPD